MKPRRGNLLHASPHVARRLRPDFAYAELQGGSLDIMDEQPRKWAGAIIDFVRGLAP